jgi:hypothetical protein
MTISVTTRHLRGEATANFYRDMFGAEVLKSVQSDGRERVDMRLGRIVMFIAKVEGDMRCPEAGPQLCRSRPSRLAVNKIGDVVVELKGKGAECDRAETIRPASASPSCAARKTY